MCLIVGGIANEDESKGKYHIFNDVWMHTKTAVIVSVFCKDQKALEEVYQQLESNHVRIISLFGDLIASIGDTIVVDIQCDSPPAMRITELTTNRLKITDDTMKKDIHHLLFRPIPHPSQLNNDGKPYDVIYHAHLFNSEMQPIEGGFTAPLNFNWPLLHKQDSDGRGQSPEIKAHAGELSQLVKVHHRQPLAPSRKIIEEIWWKQEKEESATQGMQQVACDKSFRGHPLSLEDIDFIGSLMNKAENLGTLDFRNCKLRPGCLKLLTSQVKAGLKIDEMKVSGNPQLTIEDLMAGADFCARAGARFVFDDDQLSESEHRRLTLHAKKLQSKHKEDEEKLSKKRRFLIKEERFQKAYKKQTVASIGKRGCVLDFGSDDLDVGIDGKEQSSSQASAGKVTYSSTTPKPELDQFTKEDEKQKEEKIFDEERKPKSALKTKYKPRNLNEHVKFQPVVKLEKTMQSLEELKEDAAVKSRAAHVRNLKILAKNSDRRRFEAFALNNFGSNLKQHAWNTQFETSTMIVKSSKGDSGYKSRSTFSEIMSSKTSLRRFSRKVGQESVADNSIESTQAPSLEKIEEVETSGEMSQDKDSGASSTKVKRRPHEYDPKKIAEQKYQMTIMGLSTKTSRRQQTLSWLNASAFDDHVDQSDDILTQETIAMLSKLEIDDEFDEFVNAVRPEIEDIMEGLLKRAQEITDELQREAKFESARETQEDDANRMNAACEKLSKQKSTKTLAITPKGETIELHDGVTARDADNNSSLVKSLILERMDDFEDSVASAPAEEVKQTAIKTDQEDTPVQFTYSSSRPESTDQTDLQSEDDLVPAAENPAFEMERGISSLGGSIEIGGCSINFPPNTYQEESHVEASTFVGKFDVPPHCFPVSPTLYCKSSKSLNERAKLKIPIWVSTKDPKIQIAILTRKDGKGEQWREIKSIPLHRVRGRAVEFECTEFSYHRIVIKLRYLLNRLDGIDFSASGKLYSNTNGHLFFGLHVKDDSAEAECLKAFREHELTLEPLILSPLSVRHKESFEIGLRCKDEKYRLEPEKKNFPIDIEFLSGNTFHCYSALIKPRLELPVDLDFDCEIKHGTTMIPSIPLRISWPKEETGKSGQRNQLHQPDVKKDENEQPIYREPVRTSANAENRSIAAGRDVYIITQQSLAVIVAVAAILIFIIFYRDQYGL